MLNNKYLIINILFNASALDAGRVSLFHNVEYTFHTAVSAFHNVKHRNHNAE